MSDFIDISVLFAALSIGILGSGHCFSMCGGIAVGMGTLNSGNHIKKPTAGGVRNALLFNLGRIISYTLLGALSAWLLGLAGDIINVPQWSKVLRLLTAVMILLIGVQYLTNWQVLGAVERAGTYVWQFVSPLAVRASGMAGGFGRLLLGLCWGFLPCGLVYSVLLTAAAGGSAITGGIIMLFFGIGTLPSMLGMTLAAPSLAALLSDRWTRKLLGAALIMLAVLSALLMVVSSQSHNH